MSSSALPPLGNLPSWSRVSNLDRSRYPKPFLRDRLQTLPPAGGNLVPVVDRLSDNGPMDIQFLENLSNLDSQKQQKVVYYNKSIKFLQQQHADTLKKLHEEIDRLKQENKDLQFKFVMGRSGVSSESNRPVSAEKLPESTAEPDLQSLLLQEEIKDLRLALKNSHGRNMLLQHALQLQSRRSKTRNTWNSKVSQPPSSTPDVAFSPGDGDVEGSLSAQSSTLPDPSFFESGEMEPRLPFGATLDPLRIQPSSNLQPRSPSVEECEVIIKYLHRLTARQSEENQLLKADIKDLLCSEKPGNRSSKSRSTDMRKEETVSLPKVSFKQNISSTATYLSASSSDRVTLPALKNTIPTNIAERRKRQQAVQKNRTKREGSHHV